MTSQLYHMQTCTSAVVEQNKIILAENDFQNVLNNAIIRDEEKYNSNWKKIYSPCNLLLFQ